MSERRILKTLPVNQSTMYRNNLLFEGVQEEGKFSDLLKWLTLPIQASSFALEGFPLPYQEKP